MGRDSPLQNAAEDFKFLVWLFYPEVLTLKEGKQKRPEFWPQEAHSLAARRKQQKQINAQTIVYCGGRVYRGGRNSSGRLNWRI